MAVDETLRQLKLQFRSFMNGPVSASLRDKGLGYRVIYGVEWPRLVALAAETEHSSELAAALWKEDIRECRLMAGLVQPADSFAPDLAEEWVVSMRYAEEAHYLVLTLLSRVPYARRAAQQWIARPEEMFQLTGYLMLARLFMNGEEPDDRHAQEFLDQAATAVRSTNASLAQAARNALLKYSELCGGSLCE